MKTKYLLLMEPSEEVLELQRAALACFYKGDISSHRDIYSATEELREKGEPELILADSSFLFHESTNFYSHLDRAKITSPLIATSLEPLSENLLKKYPGVLTATSKNFTRDTFLNLIQSYIQAEDKSHSHVPVKTSFLLQHSIFHLDLFIKLSATNFVKVLNANDPFADSELLRLSSRGLNELYIESRNADLYLNLLDEKFKSLDPDKESSGILAMEYLESLESVAKSMNWPKSTLESAQRSVNEAIGILSKNKKVLSILKVRLNTPGSHYSKHIGLLTYLTAGLGGALNVGESGQVKLALAALLHDLSVPENHYEDIKSWNKKARNREDKSPEVVRYRMHPFDAAKVFTSMDNPLQDVDQILLQHHELKDGTGFPRGIASGRITQLASIFIMVEDFLDFLEEGENIETSLTDFITWGRFYYDSGHFMKIFESLERMLEKN